VSQVVNPDPRHAGGPDADCEGGAEPLLADWEPQGIREHQVGLLPRRAGQEALARLARSVAAQQLHQRRGDRDLAPRAVGFGWGEHQAGLNPVERLLDAQRAGIKVDVAPAQAPELTESQAGVDRRGEQRPELWPADGLKEPRSLRRAEGAHLAMWHPWRADGVGGVDCEHLPFDGLLECLAKDSVSLDNSPRRERLPAVL
jgi:hypothetical protein